MHRPFTAWGLSIFELATVVAVNWNGEHTWASWLNLWARDPERPLPAPPRRLPWNPQTHPPFETARGRTIERLAAGRRRSGAAPAGRVPRRPRQSAPARARRSQQRHCHTVAANQTAPRPAKAGEIERNVTAIS